MPHLYLYLQKGFAFYYLAVYFGVFLVGDGSKPFYRAFRAIVGDHNMREAVVFSGAVPMLQLRWDDDHIAL